MDAHFATLEPARRDDVDGTLLLACFVDALPPGSGYRVDGLALYCSACGICSDIVPGSEATTMDEPEGAWLADAEERMRNQHRIEVAELHASLGLPVPD